MKMTATIMHAYKCSPTMFKMFLTSITELTCEPLTVKFSNVTGVVGTYKQTVTIQCQTGYILDYSGQSTLSTKCSVSGWSAIPECFSG